MRKALAARPELRVNSEFTGKALKELHQGTALARILMEGLSGSGVQRLEVL